MKALLRLGLVLALMGGVVAACGDDDEGGDGGNAATDEDESTTDETAADLEPVRLQLQWLAQSQFAGYYAAAAEGYYEDEGLDVDILEGGVDIVPQQVLASGEAEFGIAWVPKALVSREEGADIVDIAQVYQRSGTLQVSLADAGIEGVADLEGKNVGNWGFGNEFELFAGLRQAGLDPEGDVSLVQQQFDMNALLNGEIDAAQAMRYNEYAQVLEQENPDTGELFQPEELSVIDWNEEGTAMLQDAIWANADYLADNEETAVAFVKASLRGWIFCRDNFDACVQHVLDEGDPTLGEGHMRWQLNEVNRLVWPSPEGVGTITDELWQQTVEVATSENVVSEDPGDDAYTNDIVTQALDQLRDDDVDVTGEDWEAEEIEITPGGQ